jgi:sugar lactone lactonase YvrE
MTMQLPVDRAVGHLELVHAFNDQMPVGVAISRSGRTFLTYPKWEQPVRYTLGELVDGRERPFGSGVDFVSCQGIVIDKHDRLWVLDNASVDFGPIDPKDAKLVCFDLRSNQPIQTITFDPSVVDANTFLNDLRIDLSRGDKGTVYMTDSGEKSVNGIIVCDLASGRSWRRLANHPSVKPAPAFLGVCEGRAFKATTGVDGIAISPDGETIFYTANSARRLYAVKARVLADPAATDDDVSSEVQDLGEKGVADGLGEDAAGNVYTTNYEHNAILRRAPDGSFSTIVHDPELLWPDTIVIHDGYLYVTANQLNRMKQFNKESNCQERPFSLFRVKVDAEPVRL